LYDASTGAQLELTEVDVDRLGLLHWMADNRIVAESDGPESLWLSWDGTTLAELASLPLDFTCGEGRADKTTGAVYSSDGLTGMSDTLCRFDTNDGSIVRTSDGVLAGAERFWLRPGTGEVVVLHSPNPDVELELVTLDGATLAPTSQSGVPFTEYVQEVGDAVWLTDQATNASRIEPGAIPLPRLSPGGVSAAATIFVATNDSNDIVLVSSTDGTVLGVMPAGMNLAFSDWSPDDSVFARLAAADQVEVYRL
jgi:hypothetical protein